MGLNFEQRLSNFVKLTTYAGMLTSNTGRTEERHSELIPRSNKVVSASQTININLNACFL